MALFNNSFSGLITNGLGMPACCGLLTMGFGLFKCTIEIVVPPIPPSGGGGGPYVANGYYVPLTRPLTHTTKLVLVTVTMNNHTWKKSYVVDRTRAKVAVAIVNMINSVRGKITIGVDSLRKAARSVVASFSNRQ